MSVRETITADTRVDSRSRTPRIIAPSSGSSAPAAPPESTSVSISARVRYDSMSDSPPVKRLTTPESASKMYNTGRIRRWIATTGRDTRRACFSAFATAYDFGAIRRTTMTNTGDQRRARGRLATGEAEPDEHRSRDRRGRDVGDVVAHQGGNEEAMRVCARAPSARAPGTSAASSESTRWLGTENTASSELEKKALIPVNTRIAATPTSAIVRSMVERAPGYKGSTAARPPAWSVLRSIERESGTHERGFHPKRRGSLSSIADRLGRQNGAMRKGLTSRRR